MKKILHSLKPVLLTSLFGLAIMTIACNKDDNNDKLQLSGEATGAQEVPAVNSAASASLSGTYNKSTKELNYTISWTGLSGNVVAAHFHGPAAVGKNAPPIIAFTITNNGSTASLSGTATLADTTAQHLLNGLLYYNLHTAAHPGGEIRAQVSTY